MAKTLITNKTPVLTERPELSERYIDDFLNTEVKNYAHYVVISRALPNIMDGLRIGGRKIMWAALNGDLRKYKKIKMVDMIGDTMKYEFHHGDSSLKNTIEQFGSGHLFETAPLKIIGQKGSLRVPDATTAARYLEVAATQYIDLFKTDTELLERIFEDGKWTEPKYFMPLVPIVLLWRTNSPGFGFSFRSFSYRFEDVLDATICSVVNGTCSGLWDVPLKPRILGIKDENLVWNEAKASWYNVGTYSFHEDTLSITDLPYGVSFAKYTILLNELKEKGVISDWYNRKTKTQPILYVAVFPKGGLQKAYKDKWRFYGMFKLYQKIPKLTLNIIDKDCKSIVYFDTAQDLIDGFVKRRLEIYRQRKVRMITIIDQQIIDLEDKAKFIQLVVDGKIIVVKRPKAAIAEDCKRFGVTEAGMQLEIYRLTPEEIEKANEKVIALKQELAYIKATSIEDMYKKDLVDLRRKYMGIVPGIGFVTPKKALPKGVIEI
jgi:DNA topoisomerase-2